MAAHSNRTQIGTKVTLKVTKEGERILLLILDLCKNEYKVDQYYDLWSWFAYIEDLAWEKVNTFFVED